MSVIVVATARPRPGQRDEVIAAFEKAIARTHAEDAGRLLYALHEAPDRLVMIEKWADQAALAAHSRSAGLVQLTADLDGKLTADVEVAILTPHPAGTTEQGTL
jgi:quinol monooxygenase YgiN